jgi:hypothetical protein
MLFILFGLDGRIFVQHKFLLHAAVTIQATGETVQAIAKEINIVL